MCFIKYVLRIPLRMSEAELLAGSNMIHGEAAYVFGPCEAHEQMLAGHYIKKSETGPDELGMGVVTLGQDPHAEKGPGSGTQEVKLD
jgi:Amt family ammonium transporter